jgi:hypothetical protein
VSLAASFLERNSWVPGVAVAVVLFALTWLFNLILRRRDMASKTLDYRVLSDVPILSHRPDDNQLKITYMGEEIDNPRLVRVWFANTGNEVIRASEILEQFVLTVGARIVTLLLAEQSARVLTAFELTTPNYPVCEVALTLATLNPGDDFTLQMIVDSEERTDISVWGRIEDETRSPMIHPSAGELADVKINAVMAFVCLALFWALGVPILVVTDKVAGRVIGAICMLLGVVMFVVVMRASIRFRRKLHLRTQMEADE